MQREPCCYQPTQRKPGQQYNGCPGHRHLCHTDWNSPVDDCCCYVYEGQKAEAVGKLKSPGSQYTELEMPRRIDAIHSGVYDAIDNLPPDLPSDGKPYAVDDMYVLPVD
uniref:Uncharacterized protein LOC111125228 n=1 Tax=Crassostrea virginica TaxID=6565 RepID=A0A8B8DA31_CRAVI|nr:uncharacterized protein LOC111125228 [Crassostrea virginica]